MLVASLAITAGMVSAAETTTFLYDAKGRLLVRDSRRGGQGGLLDAYQFDGADNRVHSTISGPFVVDHLSPNTSLSPGQAAMSADGRFLLTFQADGNLVLYDQSHNQLWSSGTAGAGGTVLAMQSDGNLVIYNSSGQGVWHTATYGHSGAQLAIQTDGNLDIYATDGTPLWSSNTCCH